MAGLALALDLLKTSASTAKSVHSFSSLSALPAALSACVGVTFLPSYPAYSPQFERRDWTGQFAFCEEAEDAEEPWTEPDARWLPQWDVKGDGYSKAYNVELKPLFSAFRPRALGATTVRACLVNFLPLLEAYIQPEEDELEEDADRPANLPLDPVLPLKRSATHILREVAVITTRRVLERATVHFASRRMAWKLLKDVPKSAVRKAGREPSKWRIFVGVTRTTFKGHALGVIANWVVQLVLDVHRYIRCFVHKRKTDRRKQDVDNNAKNFDMLLRKTVGNTLKGGASLVLASVGAGLGTILIKPSIGTWIDQGSSRLRWRYLLHDILPVNPSLIILGCAAGDLAGAYLIGMWFDAWIFCGTFFPPSQDP